MLFEIQLLRQIENIDNAIARHDHYSIAIRSNQVAGMNRYAVHDHGHLCSGKVVDKHIEMREEILSQHAPDLGAMAIRGPEGSPAAMFMLDIIARGRITLASGR